MIIMTIMIFVAYLALKTIPTNELEPDDKLLLDTLSNVVIIMTIVCACGGGK